MANTKREVAHDIHGELRRSIARGRHRPNQRLIETELAEELGVSRTPIRQALQLLEAEGLVVRERHGWTVREYSAEEVRDLYDVRMALEGHAARRAAERISEEQLEDLRACQAEMRALDLDDEGDRQRLVALNTALHEAVVRASGNDRLARLAERHWAHYFNHRTVRLYSSSDARAAIHGHDAILDALASRDPDAAQAAVLRHLEEALAITVRLHLS